MSSQRRTEDSSSARSPVSAATSVDPGLQVQGPHGVADLGVGVSYRLVVLEVAVAHAGVPGQAPPALVHELPGQIEVGGGTGLAVELGQRRLDDRVPVQAPLLARELAHQVVGQAHGDGEQPGRRRRPRCIATAAWIRWPAQYISWLQASLAYRGSPLTWK